MTITRQDDTLLLKDGTITVKCADSVELGTFTAPGPGEYDVSGVSCIVLPQTEALATTITFDNLTVLYVDRPIKLDKDDEDLANIDVIVTRVATAEQLKAAQTLIKDFEPSGWAIFGTLPAADIAKELNLSTEPEEKWTVTAAGLPEEGMQTVVLA